MRKIYNNFKEKQEKTIDNILHDMLLYDKWV